MAERISRRKMLARIGLVSLFAAQAGAMLSGACYLTYKYLIMRKPFHDSYLHLPILKRIILREGEEYFALPEEKKVESLEMLTGDIYPRVQRSIDSFMGEKIDYPALYRLSALNIHSGYFGLLAAAWFVTFNKIQKKVKYKNMKSLLKAIKYLGSLNFILMSVKGALYKRGTYNGYWKSISISLGDQESDSARTIAHEVGHYLFDRDVLGSYPVWATEGFAMGFSNAVGLSGKGARKDSLDNLVNVYEILDDAGDLPERFSEFRPSLGIGVPNPYSYGYAFFRMMEEQRGKGIYREILKDGDLRCLLPLPAASPKDD